MSERGRAADEQPEKTEAPRAEPAEPSAAPPTPLTQQIGRVVIGLVAVLFLVFAFVNRQRVTFDWILGQSATVETPEGVVGGVPLIFLLLGAFLLGIVIGAGLLWRTQRARRGAPTAPPAR